MYIDTVMKKHVASLQDKHSRAHNRASRHSISSVRQRHKRPAPPSKLSTHPPISSAYESELNREASPVAGLPSSTPIFSEINGQCQRVYCACWDQ